MHNDSIRGIEEDVLPNTVILDDGCTALYEAVSIGDEKALIILLNRGVDRNAKETKYGNTALHEAAWRGFSRSVKLLCTLPPVVSNDVNNSKLNLTANNQNIHHNVLHSALLGVRNAGGFSALHLAAQNGHNQTCREILLAGANPDVQNNYGDTPIHTACRYGHAGATRILISAKSDLNRINLNGDTPLHIACAMGRRKLTKILLSSGAIINIKNCQSETPKDIATRKKLAEIVDILNNSAHIENIKQYSKVGLTLNDKSNTTISPIKWSPYGCHYFPDPKTFPSPKIETLPKEPLNKGEQYYIDLAGNIRKGPVGVANTCYCGPFFRHIEERISKNRKSISQYVHKATQRLDNKVQALALKTDDQIEQLTRSMLADRIKCEGRRLHLDHCLKRGDPLRVTTGGYCYTKSKKNDRETNILKKSKSLELLSAKKCKTYFSDTKMQMCNAKSISILDDNEITNHRSSDDHDNNSKSFINNKHFIVSESLPVTKRLEELLIKTNKIFEMEKIDRLKPEKSGKVIEYETDQKKLKNPNKNKSIFQIPDDKTTITKLKRKSLLYNTTEEMPPNLIEKQMKKITESLTGVQIEKKCSKLRSEFFKTNGSTNEYFTNKDEPDYGNEQKQEKINILGNNSIHNYSPNDYLNSAEMSISNDIPSYFELSSGKHKNNFEVNFNKLKSTLRTTFINKEVGPSIVHDREISNESHNNNYKQTDNEVSDYNEDHATGMLPELSTSNTSFFRNECFDDTKSSSNNTTLKSVHHINISSSKKKSSKTITDKINNPCEINDLKSLILNQSVWRSEALKQSQQIINDNQVEKNHQKFENYPKFCKIFHGGHGDTNVVTKKFEIKNSEIKPLKQPNTHHNIKTKIKPVVASNQEQNEKDNYPNSIDINDKCEDFKLSDENHKYSHATNNHYYSSDNVDSNLLPLEQNQMLLMTTKKSIPKDAYFHEIYNKNNFFQNSDKLLQKQMLHTNPSEFGRRTRSAVHYVHQDYIKDKLSKEKFYENEKIPPTHPLRISLTPEKIQFDRDLSNDSGFSMKMGGSSHDPSPCLFNSNSEYTSSDVLNSNVLSRSNLKENSNIEPSLLHFFVGNTSSLV